MEHRRLFLDLLSIYGGFTFVEEKGRLVVVNLPDQLKEVLFVDRVGLGEKLVNVAFTSDTLLTDLRNNVENLRISAHLRRLFADGKLSVLYHNSSLRFSFLVQGVASLTFARDRDDCASDYDTYDLIERCAHFNLYLTLFCFH